MVRDMDSIAGRGAATSVSYGADAMELVAEHAPTDSDIGYVTVQLWALLNPAVGADDITVNWSGAVARGGCGSVSLFGVDQAAPFVGLPVVADSDGDFSSAPLVTAPVTAAGQWLIDVVYNMASSQAASQSGQTARVNELYGDGSFFDNGGMSTREAAGAGSVAMGWTHPDDGYWGQLAVVLAEAAGGGEEGDTDLASAAAVGSMAQVLTAGSVSIAAESAVALAGTAAALASTTLGSAASLDAAVQAQVDAAVSMAAGSGLQTGAAMAVGVAVNLAVAAAVVSAAGQTSEAALLLGVSSEVAQEAGLTVQVDTAFGAEAGMEIGSLRTISVGIDFDAGSAVASGTSAAAMASVTMQATAAVNLLGAAAVSAGIEFASIANIVTNGTTTSGDIITPDGRTYRVVFDNRVLAIAAEDRTLIVTH